MGWWVITRRMNPCWSGQDHWRSWHLWAASGTAATRSWKFIFFLNFLNELQAFFRVWFLYLASCINGALFDTISAEKILKLKSHKVLTYIEYRLQRSVWRLPNYWPPPPLHPASVSSPRTSGGGGVNISEDDRHWIGLLQYNLSTWNPYRLILTKYCRNMSLFCSDWPSQKIQLWKWCFPFAEINYNNPLFLCLKNSSSDEVIISYTHGCIRRVMRYI